MIAVVASRLDAGALALAARWPDAAVLACEDLSRAGWELDIGDPAAGRAVVGGAVVRAREIRGVVVRRPRVFAAELAAFPPDDREFVASEMTAFLLAWLTALGGPELDCAVVNAPTPGCLFGPGWTQLRWVATAARLGIAVVPARARVPAVAAAPARELVTVTAVDGRCVGDVGGAGAACDAIADAVARLMQAANVRALVARFALDTDAAPRFVDATPLVDRIDDAVAAALYAALGGGDAVTP